MRGRFQGLDARLAREWTAYTRTAASRQSSVAS